MSFQTIINVLDLYGFKPQLFIGGFKRSGSLIGLISTILSIIMGFSISFYFFLKLFNTNEFTVITSEITPEGIESLELSNNTFYFSFALEDPITYKSFVDESIYYPKVYYKEAHRDQKEGFIWTEKILDFGPCELNDFGSNYHKFLINHNLSNYYCIKNLNETIKGIFQKNEYSFIFVELYQCQNITGKKNCKSQQEIDYYLNGTFLAIDYQDITIDPNNYSNPGVPRIGEFYTTISKQYFKEIHLYFKKVIVKSDRGWIFTNYKNKEYIQNDYSENMFSFKSSVKGNFLEFSIKFGDKIQTFYRTYTKAATALSNIGGFLKLIQTSFHILCYIFVDNKVYQNIINKIFYFDDDILLNNGTSSFKIKRSIIHMNSNNLNQKKMKKILNVNLKTNVFKVKNKSIININSSSNMSKNSYEQSPLVFYKIKDEFKNPNTNLNSVSNKITVSNFNNYNTKMNIFKDLQNIPLIIQSKKINLNYCQRFCSRLKYKEAPNVIKLYQKGIKLIEQKLDVISIIKDSFQFSLLKIMFFNKEHILILDHIIKTGLNGEKYDKTLTSFENFEKINNEIKDAYNLIFNRYQNKNILNEQDNELYYIDYYFIQLLNEQFNNNNIKKYKK